jgi:hypothetical protein
MPDSLVLALMLLGPAVVFGFIFLKKDKKPGQPS